jgi:transposase
LSPAEEAEILAEFAARAKQGGVLVVTEVKAAYENRVGRAVPKSTVYRMLARHGWRKIVPRRRHPRANREQQEAFKKNSPRSCGKRSDGKRPRDDGCD